MLEDLADQWHSSAADEESLLKLVQTLRAELDRITERHERERKMEITSSAVRGVLAARKRRQKYFPERFFGEPAWDMLLELFASDIDGQRISIMSLCAAADAADATGVRWFGTLEQAGLTRREQDTEDKRRAWVQLTPKGRSAMRCYFLEVPETC